MDAIAHAFLDPTVRGWYLIGCLALLLLPMMALAVWFHRGIRHSPGGRALMQRQRGARTCAGDARRRRLHAGDGASIMRDINAGRYGQHAKAMMTRVYWFTGAWVVVNAIAFGILIWADEINRVVD
ncbi:hypothetical protein AUC71_12150 [Methyloceanibacter marginalis]|uniref:Uncharacterized protein n=1 Tax=Methyloceanibacter marginalis TaxID=1774971 RepID=A0A1E3WB19_9HYPH|nr:hypothetical protein [Methyloceanibacter marginalis]ODS02999.1 hypothetical protein AUC71_12150 [Methyloceanibacter marginalis]